MTVPHKACYSVWMPADDDTWVRPAHRPLMDPELAMDPELMQFSAAGDDQLDYSDSYSYSDDHSDSLSSDGSPVPWQDQQQEPVAGQLAGDGGGGPPSLELGFDFLSDGNLNMLPQPEGQLPDRLLPQPEAQLPSSGSGRTAAPITNFQPASVLGVHQVGAAAFRQQAAGVQPQQLQQLQQLRQGGVKQEPFRSDGNLTIPSVLASSVQQVGAPRPPAPVPAYRAAARGQPVASRAVQRPQQQVQTVAARPAQPVNPTVPQRCPHCGRREDGAQERAEELAAAPGRYKARKQPRKENPLALWNNKYGYAGEPYCKGCSESFRSHLLRQGHKTRSGCSREAPCVQCTKVLNGFDRPKDTVFAQFDADREARMQKRQAAANGKRQAGAGAAGGGGGGASKRPPDPASEPVSQGSRKRKTGLLGALAMMSTIGVIILAKTALKAHTSADDLGGDTAASADASSRNTSDHGGLTFAVNDDETHNSSLAAAVSAEMQDHESLQDSPLWSDAWSAFPALVHHKLAVSAFIAIVLACCGRRARRQSERQQQQQQQLLELDGLDSLTAASSSQQAKVRFLCCGSHGGAVTWARWLVAFSVVGCIYSLCIFLLILFTWDLTWDAPRHHKAEAVFSTAETLTLFAAMPMFLIRFKNLPYRNFFWSAWGFFAVLWVFSTMLRSRGVQSVAAHCTEDPVREPDAGNAADTALAAQGSSCDLVIAAGLADCESTLAPMGEFAHSCDVACGFRECDDDEVDTRTRDERLRGELLALLGWVQLAHPLLNVALGIVIWQAVVQAKEDEAREDEESGIEAAAAGEDVNGKKGGSTGSSSRGDSDGGGAVVISRQSLSLGLLDKAVTPWCVRVTALTPLTVPAAQQDHIAPCLLPPPHPPFLFPPVLQ